MTTPQKNESSLLDLITAWLLQAGALWQISVAIVAEFKRKNHEYDRMQTEAPARLLGAGCAKCSYVVKISKDEPDAMRIIAERMTEHMQTEHPEMRTQRPDYSVVKDDDLQDAYECRHCGERRTDEEAVQAHLRMVHGIK